MSKMSTLRNRLLVKQGFSLVETLLALAILGLLTGMVAVGIPMAYRTYQNALDVSNAQVALTTATTELRNELGLSSHVWVDSSNKVIAFESSNGYLTELKNDNSGVVKLQYYNGTKPTLNDDGGITNTPAGSQDLVSSVAMTNDLKMDYGLLTYDSTHRAFVVSKLAVNSGGSELASVAPYEVKAIMLDNAETV